MRPWLFTIGDIGVPSYWALLMIGFSAAFYLAWREARRDGLDPNRVLDLCLVILIAGIVGARLMHVLAEEDPLRPGTPILYHYLDHPGDIFRLWNGLAFYGGLIFAGLAALVFSRLLKLPLAKVADMAGVGIPLGLIFGRLGCFMAGCCHGGTTSLPWGVQFEDPASLARPLAVSLHPTQLYSALFALMLFALMMMLKRRWKQYDGQVFLSFCVLYSSGRFVIEFFRNDNRGEFFDGYLSASQLVALPIVALSLVLMVLAKRKKTDSDSADSIKVDSAKE